MRRLSVFFLLLSASVAAQVPDVPFTVEVVEVIQTNAPALHSGAAAQYDGRWLFVAGRTNGLHGIVVAPPSFPSSGANSDMIVYDPATDAVWSASLASLPDDLGEPLQATNVEYHQEGETLYVVGGYGESTAAGGFVTFETLTTIDVPGLIDAVVNGTSLVPHLRQATDSRLAVTGGHIVLLGDRYYLAGGQRFDGEYAFVPAPGQQAYTEAVRSFRIANVGGMPAVADFSETVDADRLHRRDGNIGPVIRDGEEAWALYGGVFRTDAILPHRTPIYFDADTIEEGTYEAQFGHYTSALLPIYDASEEAMHTVFFGGMNQFYFDEATGTVQEDQLIPFVSDVSVLSVAPNGSTGETLLDSLDALLGTNSYVFFDETVPMTGHGVILLDELQGRTRVGHFLGGLAADAPHPGFMPSTGSTWASDRVFELYVTPLTNPANETGPDAGFAVTLAGPNPFRDRTRLAVTLDQPGSLEVVVFDAVGRQVVMLHDGAIASGTHLFDLDGTRLPSGVYSVRVAGAQGVATERLVRLR